MSPEEYAKSQEIVQIVITKEGSGFKISLMSRTEVVDVIKEPSEYYAVGNIEANISLLVSI